MTQRMKMTMLLAVCVAALPSLATRATGADTVDVALGGYGAGDWTTFWGAGYDDAEAVAGVYMLNKSNGSGAGNTWSNGLVGGFCMELQEGTPQNTSTYQVMMPDNTYNSITGQTLGTTKANYLRELWGRHYDSSWSGSGPFNSGQNDSAEAFAAAVWEIIYEDLPATSAGWDVTADGTAGIAGFYAQDLNASLANTWLHGLTGSGPKADLRAFVYQGRQDYLVAVPEPATVILLGLGGLLSLAGRRRRQA